MAYYLINNYFEIIPYEYPDKFDIYIYYMDKNTCFINVKRLDSLYGWGLLLSIKIYDIKRDKYDIINIGNSNENIKSLSYNLTILLECNKNNVMEIPNSIKPRNDLLLKNRYNILNNINNIDFHIVIYYIDDNTIKIILRRLDDLEGWNYNMKLIIYDYDVDNRIEYINIEESEINYKIFFKKTKIKMYYYDNNYEQKIPKIIFQTGNNKTYKNILHYNSVMSLIELNPEYTYIYFNDLASRKFLNENFNEEINYSYNILVPGAYKADLIRYCFLYYYGGCYFDCKQILRMPIRFFLNSEKTLVLCNDVIDNALLNAIIFSVDKNTIIEKCLKDCIYNILNKLGSNALDITGPNFFYKSIKDFITNDNLLLQNNRPFYNFNDFSSDYYNNNITIIENNKVFLTRFYKGYYDNYLDKNHYGILFTNNEIYYKNYQQIDNLQIFIYPNKFNDYFLFTLENKKLIVKRVDSTNGWELDLKIIIIDSNLVEYNIVVGSSVNNTKIIDLF